MEFDYVRVQMVSVLDWRDIKIAGLPALAEVCVLLVLKN